MSDDVEGTVQGEPAAAPIRLLHGGGYIYEFTTIFLLVLKLGSETHVLNGWYLAVSPFNKAHESCCLKPEQWFINLFPESYLSTS